MVTELLGIPIPDPLPAPKIPESVFAVAPSPFAVRSLPPAEAAAQQQAAAEAAAKQQQLDTILKMQPTSSPFQ